MIGLPFIELAIASICGAILFQNCNTYKLYSSIPKAKKRIRFSCSSVPCSVGIDLGTTFSLASIVLPTVIKNSSVNERANTPIIVPIDSHRMLPSIVAYKHGTKACQISVGYDAAEYRKLFPDNSFSSVKRVIGRTFEEVKSLTALGQRANSLGMKASEMAIISQVDIKGAAKLNRLDSPCRLKCPALGGTLSPEEVSAEILMKLLISAREFISAAIAEPLSSVTIENAVITVPAYFSNSQRNATIR